MAQSLPPKELARIFGLLSADTRIRIVQLLKRRSLCVGALSTRLGITQGAVSQHLRLLRDAGVVVADRQGYYVHYRVNRRTFAKWQAALEGLFGASGRGAAGRARKKGETPCVTRRRAVKNRSS